MHDTRRRILDTLRSETTFLCALATIVGDGRPRVRTMRGAIDDELVLRCPTFIGTDKVDQIRANPEVHVTCGDTDSTRPGSYLQIEGRAEISTETADRLAAWNDHLAKWFSGPDDPNYAVVKVSPYRITALPIGGGPSAEVWESER